MLAQRFLEISFNWPTNLEPVLPRSIKIEKMAGGLRWTPEEDDLFVKGLVR